MANPTIDINEPDLAALMAELEAETGVSAVAVPKPAVTTVAETVIVEDDLSALADLEIPVATGTIEVPAGTVISSGIQADSSMFTSEELAEMEELENISKSVKPKADPDALKAGLAALAKGGVVKGPEEVLVDEKIPATPEDELALLTAELAEEALPKTTQSLPELAPGDTTTSIVIEVNAADSADTSEIAALIAESVKETKADSVGSASASPSAPSSAPIPIVAPAKGLQFFVDPNAFKIETQIKAHDLDTCFMQQSSLRAYYGTMAANAEAQAARSKTKFEVLEARLYDYHRKALTDSGAKVTEKMVENAVKTDPRWLSGKESVIDADTIAAVNKALAISLADRRDMLYQLGADRRDEAKGQARMNAIREEQASLANRATAGASALKQS